MCWLFHKWGKWEDTATGNLMRENGNIIGAYIRQERRCPTCGKVQLRVVKVWADRD